MTRKKSSAQQPKTNRLPIWAILIVVLAAIGVAVVLTSNPPATTSSLPLEISVAQAAQMREQGAFVLDVRQPEE